MDKFPSLQEVDEEEGSGSEPRSPSSRGGLFSCWACLMKRVMPPWRRLRGRGSERWHVLRSSSVTTGRRRPKPGHFRYDPLSYSQNFEDSLAWRDKDDDDASYRAFSSRFVVINPPNPRPDQAI